MHEVAEVEKMDELVMALNVVDAQIADELAQGNRRAARVLRKLQRLVDPQNRQPWKKGNTSFTRLKKRHLAALTAALLVFVSASSPAEAFKKGAAKRTLIRYGLALPAALVGGAIGALAGAGASLLTLKIATDPKPDPIVIDEKPVHSVTQLQQGLEELQGK